MSSKLLQKVLKNKSNHFCIYGIDEVGRGPLAGPVMAACVFIPPEIKTLPFWADITDSKKLSIKKRNMLYPHITQHSIWGVGECSPEEIDQINIHHATLKAMKRAFNNCPDIKDEAVSLIDGKFCPELPCPSEAIIKGDSKYLEIAAASVIAKVTRDRYMRQIHEEFPYYGWDRNSGYGTKEHLLGITKYGITPYHRKSFSPCSEKKLIA